MSQSAANDFSKWVPGFDFLQKMAASPGGAGTPSVSSWVAPTLDPKELERRIQDLKTVQFWLEQNTQAVAATIQALEVQRMTLATLQGMNVSMGQLAEALKVQPAASVPTAEAAPAQSATSGRAKTRPKASSKTSGTRPQADTAGAVDPMAWWGSLTQQFQQIAGDALKDMQDKAQKMAPAPATSTPGQAAPRRRAAPSTRQTKAAAGRKRS
jgi:hypothetical protein